MFDSILFKNKQGPGPLLDIGAIAEALIFYGRVAIVGNTATLKDLLARIPPLIVLRLLQDRRIEFYYLSDQVGVLTTPEGTHDLLQFSSPDHTIERVAAREFKAAARGTTEARIPARRFERLLKPIGHDGFDKAEVLSGLSDISTSDAAAAGILEIAVPNYPVPNPVRFRIDRVENGIQVDTNIDFVEVNKSYHKLVSPSHSSMSPAYMLSIMQDAFEATYFSAKLDSEVAVTPMEHTVHSRLVESVIQRRAKSAKDVAAFTELTLTDAHAIREAVNSGVVSFSQIVRLLDTADKFRDWLRNQPSDVQLIRSYYREVVRESWVERLPSKGARWAVCTGAGLGADAFLGAGGLGTALGAAIGAIDSLLIDKWIKGWRPHHFVEGDLALTFKSMQKAGPPSTKEANP